MALNIEMVMAGAMGIKMFEFMPPPRKPPDLTHPYDDLMYIKT